MNKDFILLNYKLCLIILFIPRSEHLSAYIQLAWNSASQSITSVKSQNDYDVQSALNPTKKKIIFIAVLIVVVHKKTTKQP
jgi:hypothetical protein